MKSDLACNVVFIDAGKMVKNAYMDNLNSTGGQLLEMHLNSVFSLLLKM